LRLREISLELISTEIELEILRHLLTCAKVESLLLLIRKPIWVALLPSALRMMRLAPLLLLYELILFFLLVLFFLFVLLTTGLARPLPHLTLLLLTIRCRLYLIAVLEFVVNSVVSDALCET